MIIRCRCAGTSFPSTIAPAVVLLAVGLAGHAAEAQTLPSGADPGRVQERIQGLPPVAPEAAPLEIPTVGPEAPPAGAETMRFHLTAITLQGNDSIATEELAPLYAEALDQDVTLAGLYAIAARITAVYRERGYILSQALIPAQRIEGGHATIAVVEGFIDQVALQGDDRSGRIAAMAAKIAATRPLTSAVLERYLLLIQDLDGVAARAVLAPSDKVEGAADLTLVLTRDAVGGYVSIDNRGTRSIGPYEATAALQVNNPLGFDGKAGVTFFTAPLDDELYYLQGSLQQPIGHDGVVLQLSAAYSWTHPGAGLEPYDNEGHALGLDAGLEYPLLRARDGSIYLSLGFSWRDSTSDFFASTAPVPIYDDHLRVLRPGVRMLARDGLGGSDTLDLILSQGLGLLGASRRGDADLSRANGDPGFTAIAGQASRTQPLSDDFALVARTSFQYSADPLLAAEEIGFGGTSFGAAFDPSAISGDSGIGGRLEAVWYWALAPEDVGTAVYGQGYGFAEGAAIWQRDPLPSERRHDALSAAGLGVRAQLDGGVTGGLELAFPLNHPNAATRPDSARLFFQLGASF